MQPSLPSMHRLALGAGGLTLDGPPSVPTHAKRDADGLEVIRHSTAHLLAQAVKTLFPSAQVTIGPVIENGFYYDFSFERPFTPDDLAAIEAKMTEIVAADLPVVRELMKRDEAVEFFKNLGEHYKAEIIAGAWGDVVRELGRISYEDARAAVRDDAVLTLQRVLLGARELDAGGDLWLTTFDSVLFATLRELTETVRKMKGRDGGAAENTARIAVSCVTKTFLQYASKMRDEDEDAFAGALLAVIDAASSLQKHAKTDELIDAVPEAIKNVLLVVSASDIVARESELWGKMWARATAVDADLTPENLGLVVVSSSPEEPDAVAARANEIEQRVTN